LRVMLISILLRWHVVTVCRRAGTPDRRILCAARRVRGTVAQPP